MCYSGRCKYENHMGECIRAVHNLKVKLPVDHYPDDAACTLADREIEILEQAKYGKKES